MALVATLALLWGILLSITVFAAFGSLPAWPLLILASLALGALTSLFIGEEPAEDVTGIFN